MLKHSIDWLCYDLLKLDSASRLVSGVNFFLYDSVKILLLLFFMIAAIGVFRSFISQKRVKKAFGKNRVGAHLAASLFGAVTPFCSCSSIPLFISFLKSGIPLGVTFSFLITSPLINEYLVVLMLGFFGVRITIAYVISGMAMGVAAGMILGRMNLERFLEPDIVSQAEANGEDAVYRNVKERVAFGVNEAIGIVKKLWLWVLGGVGIGALIHNFVPQEMVRSVVAATGPFSVPIATLIGVPLYGSCAAIVPIAVILFQKGFPLGTALSFMMAVAALSLPEAVMLRRAMKLNLIAAFFGITTGAIIVTGYVFNFLQAMLR